MRLLLLRDGLSFAQSSLVTLSQDFDSVFRGGAPPDVHDANGKAPFQVALAECPAAKSVPQVKTELKQPVET